MRLPRRYLPTKENMKLWVDDIRTPPDDSWHIARSVSAAIRALDMFWPEIDEINLDHDISHQVVVGKISRPYPCEETFEAVARYMVKIRQCSSLWLPKIQIHTSNYVGAKNMLDLLQGAGFQVEAKTVGGANRLETIL